MRGGARQRYISRETAPVWCPGGRWGGRRVRTNECVRVDAEGVYDKLIQQAAQGHPLGPGSQGTVTYRLQGRLKTVSWEVRPNAVWKFGRVFFCCPRCSRRCARLYLPLPECDLACRRCYGLSYASKTLQNYKDSIWGRSRLAKMFQTTQRDWAYESTDERRKNRKNASSERRRKRRRYLKKAEQISSQIETQKPS